MRHARKAIVPTVRAAGKATLVVACLVFMFIFGGLGLRGRAPEVSDVVLPLIVVVAIGSVEGFWVLRRSPAKVVADERGLEIEDRAGGKTVLEWTDLASRERGLFTGRWTLKRKDGTAARLSPLGIPGDAWKDLDARVTDVLEGNGPPLAVPGEGAEPRPEVPLPETPAALLTALAGAFAGALLGAAAWGIIAAITGMEIGYVAIGVGALVGGGAAKFGGRGDVTGWACAVVALFAILAGKGFAFGLLVEKEIGKLETGFDRPMYDRIQASADDWARGVPPQRVKEYMATHGYCDEGAMPANISDEEVQAFRATAQPFLEQWKRMPPRFEQWQEGARETMRSDILSQISFSKGVADSLGPMDILFAFLGAGAALRLGKGDVPVRRATPRKTRAEKPPAPLAPPVPPRKGGRVVLPPPKPPVSEPGAPPPEPPPAAGPPPGSDPPVPRS